MRMLLAILLVPFLALSQDINQKADELMSAYTAQKKFSGTVLIAKKGELVFSKAYGMADYESAKPITTTTEFRAGSLTKMFTSTVILKLAEEGKLSLQDPVSKYFPSIKDGKTIQLKHLLSHSSGIRGNSSGKTVAGAIAFIEDFKFESPEFAAGEKFQYNNVNFILLSAIAEKITGKEIGTLMTTKIFRPLGMTHSGIDQDQRVSADKATGYNTKPETAEWVAVTPNNLSIASGAGALYTTAEDLLKWSAAIHDSKLLSRESYAKALNRVAGNYGLGWMLDEYAGKKQIGHTGAIEGFISNFMYYPEEEITIIFLSNYQDVNGRQLTEDLKAVVFNQPYKVPSTKKEIAMTAEQLAEYAGEYEANNVRVKVFVEDNKLFAIASGDPSRVELTPESRDHFFLKGPEIEIEFVRVENKVSELVLKQGGGIHHKKIS